MQIACWSVWLPARSLFGPIAKRQHHYLHKSLNGSGLIAEYLTVLVMLAWPR